MMEYKPLKHTGSPNNIGACMKSYLSKHLCIWVSVSRKKDTFVFVSKLNRHEILCQASIIRWGTLTFICYPATTLSEGTHAIYGAKSILGGGRATSSPGAISVPLFPEPVLLTSCGQPGIEQRPRKDDRTQ